MPDHSISICGVNKTFGATRAVRDLNLEVPTGSLCGFLGPNGAGKSTTIRMIMSIIYPDSGSIDVLGGTALANKDRIGYLPEERGVYRKMRVGEFLEYMGKLKGVPRSALAQRVGGWLERFELPGVRRKKCQELSKGMQQKVQLIAAIIHDPDLLILDEPFSGLDPVNSALLTRVLRELHEGGCTIIFSTHVLHQAEQLCDRIFLINHGVKLLDATLDEIRARFNPRTIVAEPLNGHAGRGSADQHIAQSVVDGISAIAGVDAVRSLDANGLLELHLAERADPQAVMRQMMTSCALRRIELRQVTLDEVFVELVMRDQGAAAAAKAREELSNV